MNFSMVTWSNRTKSCTPASLCMAIFCVFVLLSERRERESESCGNNVRLSGNCRLNATRATQVTKQWPKRRLKITLSRRTHTHRYTHRSTQICIGIPEALISFFVFCVCFAYGCVTLPKILCLLLLLCFAARFMLSNSFQLTLPKNKTREMKQIPPLFICINQINK